MVDYITLTQLDFFSDSLSQSLCLSKENSIPQHIIDFSTTCLCPENLKSKLRPFSKGWDTGFFLLPHTSTQSYFHLIYTLARGIN